MPGITLKGALRANAVFSGCSAPAWRPSDGKPRGSRWQFQEPVASGRSERWASGSSLTPHCWRVSSSSAPARSGR
jgi:hypothetical protein